MSYYDYIAQYTQVVSHDVLCLFGAGIVPPVYARLIFSHILLLIIYCVLMLFLAVMHFARKLQFRRDF